MVSNHNGLSTPIDIKAEITSDGLITFTIFYKDKKGYKEITFNNLYISNCSITREFPYSQQAEIKLTTAPSGVGPVFRLQEFE